MADFMRLLPDDTAPKRSIASFAGMRDFYLNGTNHTDVDRGVALEVQKVMPDVTKVIHEYRSFQNRCIGLMLQHGIKQFIDINSGFLTGDNTHTLAHSVNPIVHVVYVDINPAVFEHGSRLLAGSETSTIIRADIRQAQGVLEHPDLIRFIDFSKPVGVLMMYVACFFTDSEIMSIMSTLRSTVCDGSYIALAHDTLDGHKDEEERIYKVQEIYRSISTPHFFRDQKEVLKIFQGLHLVEPGVVLVNEWHPERNLPAKDAVKWLYGGLASKQSSPSMSLTKLPMCVDLTQPPKGLNTSVVTSAFVMIWCFIATLAQSLQQLKDMAVVREGKVVWS